MESIGRSTSTSNSHSILSEVKGYIVLTRIESGNANTNKRASRNTSSRTTDLLYEEDLQTGKRNKKTNNNNQQEVDIQLVEWIIAAAQSIQNNYQSSSSSQVPTSMDEIVSLLSLTDSLLNGLVEYMLDSKNAVGLPVKRILVDAIAMVNSEEAVEVLDQLYQRQGIPLLPSLLLIISFIVVESDSLLSLIL